MKKVSLFIVSIAIFSGLLLTITSAQNKEKTNPSMAAVSGISTLPASLDNLFPPATKEPIFLLQMHRMSESFTSIIVDLFENDIENITADFSSFSDEFVKLSELVPEWKDYFMSGTIDELGQALKTRNPEKIMPAYEKVGEICNNCHFTNMPGVQQKYHWRKYQLLTATDPLTNEKITFSRVMRYLDANLTGIGVDVKQGQIENARQQFQGLRIRYQALNEVCIDCHDSERHYYVDETVQDAINRLGQELDQASINPKRVERAISEIGIESCFKCHLVHVPAAATQWQMAKFSQ